MPFAVGETVGSYRIIEQLGQGGMASVYKAYHQALDRYVAIKVLHLALNEDPNFIARFRREARVVARLDHPNIVPVYDFAEYEGQPYLVMKFIEGETLKARMQRGGIFHDEIMTIVEAVGAALTYAHRMNVLHRDIKPGNIMLSTGGQIYLADFGLAKMTDSDSSLTADRLEGTPSYISPEQALSRPDLDVRTDVYSFGVMLYELIVGRVPFYADTPLGTIHEHIYTPPPLPRLINPSVSESMEQVLLKALAKDRDDRYPDINALVNAFRAAFTGQPLIPEGGVIIQSSEDEQLVFIPSHASGPVSPDISPQPPAEEPAEIPVETLAVSTPSETFAPAGGFAEMADARRDDLRPHIPTADPAAIVESASSKKKRDPVIVWIVGVIILVALIYGSFLLIRVWQTLQSQQANRPPLSDQPLATAILPNIENAVSAWKNGDMPGAVASLDRVHLTVGNDLDAFKSVLNYLQQRNDWLLAALFVYTSDRPQLIESVVSQVERIHEILYNSAADPLAGYLITPNAGKPLFVAASIRYQLNFGDAAAAAAGLDTLLASRAQSQLFPEARLLQVELSVKANNLALARQQLAAVLSDGTLPAWVHALALELDKKINPK